jgi:peptide subunit release factor 1 (eRF1)
MPKRPQQTPDEQQSYGVSRQALSVARTLDRVCRTAGTYTITLTIPPHRRHPWQLQVSRVELLRKMKL